MTLLPGPTASLLVESKWAPGRTLEGGNPSSPARFDADRLASGLDGSAVVTSILATAIPSASDRSCCCSQLNSRPCIPSLDSNGVTSSLGLPQHRQRGPQ